MAGQARLGAGLRAHVAGALQAFVREHPGRSTAVLRALLLEAPPDIDAGEITDKGYVNQRAVQARRASDVSRLFADEPGSDIIMVSAAD